MYARESIRKDSEIPSWGIHSTVVVHPSTSAWARDVWVKSQIRLASGTRATR